MKGQPWQDLVSAYRTFLARRANDQGMDDFFSVIQFASASRITVQKKLLSETPRDLTFMSGGTRYLPGLEDADKIIGENTSLSSVVLIFMSDGDDGGLPPLPKVEELVTKYKDERNFICHTIGFGSGVRVGSCEAKLLEDMATKGGGKFHLALNGLELAAKFAEIAADCTVTGTLIEKFVEILSREIGTKIAIDYL